VVELAHQGGGGGVIDLPERGDLNDLAVAAIARQVDLGLLSDDGSGVRLTLAAKFVADGVIERLL
jgi:predicted nucleic acid-binding protein